MRDNVVWFVSDFETKDESFYNKNGYTEVWLYSISNSDGVIVDYGYSIDSFIQYIQTLNNVIIYFHNLKFDGSFLLNYLMNHNFNYVEKITQKSRKSYSTLITDLGVFYSIKVAFDNGNIVEFNDSLKLLPFKVEKIANDFNLPYKKGKIDYSNYDINDDTLEYVFNDTRIVALALKQVKAQGLIKMTTASSAMNEYYNMTTYYDSLFPSIDKDDLIKWRGAYRGGRCQVNEYYRNKILKNVKRYDVNSMYPYIMYACQLPYGKPIESTKPNHDYKFELYDIDIDFKLKKGHIPTLLRSGALGINNETYYTETEGVENILISNIDLMLVYRHYDISYIKYNKVLSFKTTNVLFRKYIKKWYKIKKESKGAKRIVAKLMLNSLYGKFGSNVESQKHIPFLNEFKALSFKCSEVEELKHYYLYMAIAITSYAHALIDNAIISSGIESFIYCDTDSVHTLGTLDSEMVDNEELGKFKLEGIETRSKYLRQKTYIYEENNEIKITCAGLPQDLKDKIINEYKDINKLFSDFKYGFKVSGKLLPKQVKGGCILTNTDFIIQL